jgi:two-component system LytT family response regulator
MRVLIVDDEAPARRRLAQMLTPYADIEVAGEAESGPQAMERIGELRPDLVLLDIQMPGCSGIDVAASLPASRPHIVFCTAHEEHAVDAFELSAVDYLLKPISRARLEKALDKVRKRGAPAPSGDVMAAGRASRFLVRNGSHYAVVAEGAVHYFESEQGLTRLVGEAGSYWMDPTLNELEARLDPARFFRVSRGFIVNMNRVQEVFPVEGGTAELLMRNGARLPVSRRRYRELLEALAGR